MKRGVVFLFFLSIAFFTTAQTPDPDQLQVPVQEEIEDVKQLKEKKLHTDFTLASSFTFSPGNYYGPGIYAAPALSYSFNPRLTLSAGAGVEYGRFQSLHNSSEGSGELLPMTRMFLFTRGSYRITDRLVLGGTAIKGTGSYPSFTPNAAAFRYDYEALGVDLNYKITPSFSIGVGLRIQNGSYHSQDELIPAAGYVPWGGL